MIGYSVSIRPTRTRLLIAMGIAACSIVLILALLGPLADFAGRISKPLPEGADRLTVHIKNGSHSKNSEPTTGIETVRTLIEEHATLDEAVIIQERVAPVESPEPPPKSQPVKDWRAIAAVAAKTSGEDYVRQEESRASMWRRTHSVMFQPVEDKLMMAEEPLLSGIQYQNYSRVLGLGFNVGSCFIGIPIAGVPVEKRTVAISIFVCG